MLSPLTKSLHNVMEMTWPMVFISIVIAVSLRLTYLYKNKKPFVFYRELLMLSFLIYILCLFQVVTFQDVVGYSNNNFIPFKEILRYDIGSRLFIKNVVGNILLFVPFGFFVGYYIKLEKPWSIFFLSLLASVSIETMQMAIGRVFDVDDIFLNVIGSMSGFVLYRLFYKMKKALPAFFHQEWFLNIVSIFVLVGLLLLI